MVTELGFIKGRGIWYKGELNAIRKKENAPLQPIFEAFTNAWEAIKLKLQNRQSSEKGRIEIQIFKTSTLTSEVDQQYYIHKLVIEDSGIGFTDSEYERFINLRDDRKNFSNKGTGRVQLLHSFGKTKIISIYSDSTSSTGYKLREVILSKNEAFLKQNAIIKLEKEDEVEAGDSSTSINLDDILDQKEKDVYSQLTPVQLKQEVIKHYLAGFCENRNNLPQITIKLFHENKEVHSEKILQDDIPVPDKEDVVEVKYSKIQDNTVETSTNKESFTLKAFLLPQNELSKNALKLVSKGEIATEIRLENLLPQDQINGKRYMFLLSGIYIDKRDSDTRGEIDIPTKLDFKKRNQDHLFPDEVILLDDIEEQTNERISVLYAEIAQKHADKLKSIEELKQMFLLNPETLKALQGKIHIDDSDEVILRKVYEAEVRTSAAKDANLKQQIKRVKGLDPAAKSYQEDVKKLVNEFVKEIPLQNRAALTQYVARRKIVLDLFKLVLEKETEKLKSGGRIDEDVLHNLIFQQSSDKPEESDLWIVNEDFIYFRGVSESYLGNLKIDGEKIFRANLNAEEIEYRKKQGGDANLKRTDILLFPKEGKCIIIELKAPDENISDHLNQINRYASLINNLTKDEYSFNSYYGYLIGENIDISDVQDNDSDFKHAANFNYLYRPYKRIIGKFGKPEGSLYTEIIKYSTLLDRAQTRNKIFIHKLTNGQTS